VDPITKESRGFAFIMFEKPEDATAARDTLNGAEF